MLGPNMAPSWESDRQDSELPTSSQQRLKIDRFVLTLIGSILPDSHSPAVQQQEREREREREGPLQSRVLWFHLRPELFWMNAFKTFSAQTQGGLLPSLAASFCSAAVDLEKFSLAGVKRCKLLLPGSTPTDARRKTSWL